MQLRFWKDVKPLKAWIGKWLETMFPALVELNVIWASTRNISEWDLVDENGESIGKRKVRDVLDEVKVMWDNSMNEIAARRGGIWVPPVLRVRWEEVPDFRMPWHRP